MNKVGIYIILVLSVIVVIGFVVSRHSKIQKINDQVIHITDNDLKYMLHESLLNYYRTKYDEPNVNELIENLKEDQNIPQEWIDIYMSKDRIRIITDTTNIYIYSTLPDDQDDSLKSQIITNPIGFFDRINGDILILKAKRFNQNLSEYINGVVTYQNGTVVYDSIYSDKLLDSLKSKIIISLEQKNHKKINNFKKYVLCFSKGKDDWSYRFLVNPCSNKSLINGVSSFTNSTLLQKDSVYDKIYISFYLDVNRMKCK